jgi:hypothetical protein
VDDGLRVCGDGQTKQQQWQKREIALV